MLIAFLFMGLLASSGQPLLAGIDHVIVLVDDLDAAATAFERAGFTIKPGRPHANGIRNRHIKFADGSEIELLTIDGPQDALTAEYAEHYSRYGEGPAWVGFYSPDTEQLKRRLDELDIDHAGASPITMPAYRFVFFGRRNHSPTDRPAHFDHANGASAFHKVSVRLPNCETVDELLRGLDNTSLDASSFTFGDTTIAITCSERLKVELVLTGWQGAESVTLHGMTFAPTE